METIFSLIGRVWQSGNKFDIHGSQHPGVPGQLNGCLFFFGKMKMLISDCSHKRVLLSDKTFHVYKSKLCPHILFFCMWGCPIRSQLFVMPVAGVTRIAMITFVLGFPGVFVNLINNKFYFISSKKAALAHASHMHICTCRC